MKIIFKIVVIYLSLLDKYRTGYYKYLYGGQVDIANDLRLGEFSSIVIFPSGKNALLKICGQNTFRKSCTISLDASGKFVIGKNNFFNNGCSLTCLGSIIIGENNLFGEGVKIYDHNHVYNRKNQLVRDQGFKIGSVVIGDNCWIGSNCVILNNVTIGDNVVIGANCLVYKSIPSNVIVKSRLETKNIDIDFV